MKKDPVWILLLGTLLFGLFLYAVTATARQQIPPRTQENPVRLGAGGSPCAHPYCSARPC
jgi:hypothetical protein